MSPNDATKQMQTRRGMIGGKIGGKVGGKIKEKVHSEDR
jgi:hypothetical protein